MFFGFGVALLLFPSEVIGLAFIEASHPTARMEIRAFYGGLEIGLALYLFYSIKKQHLTHALTLSSLVLGGIILGRLFDAAIDGVEGNFLYYALLVETLLFIASLLLLRSSKDAQ